MTRARTAGVLLLLLSVGVDAQVRVVRSGDDRLTGISEVDVLVSVTPERNAVCEVSRPALQARVMDALRAAHIKATMSERDRSSFYSLVVHVESGAESGTCATSVITELVAEVEATPVADNQNPPGSWGSLLKGAMPLARQTGLVIKGAVEHDAAVQQLVHAHAAAIAARLKPVNP